MTAVYLEKIHKRFSTSIPVLSNIELHIQSGEFLVLVGPSGCGKSTLLRIIAGLERPTAGSVYFDEIDITERDASTRDVAVVFQNYALYPHMTVFENLSFALQNRKMPPRDIENKVKLVSEMLSISHLLQRKPAALSGGQKQRVAIGRAIVRDPKIFLLDEPLSNLDVQLRGQMRRSLLALQKQLGITTVYVTHDQHEAMALADRIVVLSEGRIQQIGTARELYMKPSNLFVAQCIGEPAMNIFAAPIAAQLFLLNKDIEHVHTVGIRPNVIQIQKPDCRPPFRIGCIEWLGDKMVFELKLQEAICGEILSIQVMTRQPLPFAVGDIVSISVERKDVHYFNQQGKTVR